MAPLGLLQALAALASHAGFAWLTGSLFSRFWLRRDPALLLRCEPRLRRTGLAAATACLAGGFVAIWAAAALMGEVGLNEALGMLPAVLADTAYGQAGLAGMACAALVLALQAMAPAWRYSNIMQGALLMLMALVRASNSHAGEQGIVSVAVAIEWLHVLLAGLWTGGVALAAWVVLPAARPRPPASYMFTLSAAATLALAGIVASGAFNAWQRVGSFGRFLDNPYGLVLAAKLLLFAGAVLLGAYNRFAGFPAAVRGQAAAAQLVLRIESVLLVLTLAAASLLATLAPPA